MSKRGKATGFSFRNALRISLSVSIAFMIQYIYSNEYWMVLSAFLVSQTTRGTPYKQGMLICMTMVGGIIVSSLLLANIQSFDIIYMIVAILFMANVYWLFMSRPLSTQANFTAMLFSITMLIAIFSPNRSLDIISDRIADTAIGALIAMTCRMLILPVKWDVEFSQGILPILQALSGYMQAMETDKNIAEKRGQAEDALLNLFPSWIYETGFNRGLRSGFRFFLIHVERVAEILFSMDDLIRQIDSGLMRELQEVIRSVMQKNQELFAILSEYFKQGTMSETTSDFTRDMTEFETVLHEVIPDKIEVLAVSPRLLPVAAFGRDMRDLRELLLQLVMALPVKNLADSGDKK